MEKSGSKNFGLVLAALALVGGVGYFVWSSQQQPAAAPAKDTPPTAAAPAAQPARTLPSSSLENRPMTPPTPAPVEPPSPKGAAALEEIDTVLRDQSISQGDAAQRLVALASDATVPDQMRNDALQHAMNLLPDEGFTSLDALLKTKGTPPELLDLVYHEIHNRPVEVQLPAALLLMQRTGEEISQQSRDLLSFHLEQDYGDDPTAWAKPVQDALAKAKQESAAAGVPK
jgi:hypothetical protein